MLTPSATARLEAHRHSTATHTLVVKCVDLTGGAESAIVEFAREEAWAGELCVDGKPQSQSQVICFDMTEEMSQEV